MRSTLSRAALVATLVALAGTGLVACGGGDDAAPPPPAPPPPAPPATTSPPPAPPPPQPPPPPAPAEPKPTTITITVEQGRPVGGISRPTVSKGERVVVVVRTDAGESVHLHGYDVERAVTPGRPTRLAFEATIPGRFELELHHPDVVLADITVRP